MEWEIPVGDVAPEPPVIKLRHFTESVEGLLYLCESTARRSYLRYNREVIGGSKGAAILRLI